MKSKRKPVIHQLSLQWEEKPKIREIPQKTRETITYLAVEMILALAQAKEVKTDESEAHS